MVKKETQAPPRIGGDENETETDMLESETEFNLPNDTEPETDEGQPLPRAELFPLQAPLASQKTLSSKITKKCKIDLVYLRPKKNYKVLFNRRNQKPGETSETYAAELKRIYDKAYTNRDRKIRQEDLYKRFLMGLSDHKTRVHVELYKDPSTIGGKLYMML
ncbi:unnamed protein product [Mytilus coruscus]|uniref:Uncharacterized protein n=1 Tax=Mytilus coruscus TaxID=42192 RepID=A0A6J8AQV6_MYTCO|nr:unnamed protein product [Mytilus coruscus]